eukprot:1149012-Pelagomonas_calceolata.AAC.6
MGEPKQQGAGQLCARFLAERHTIVHPSSHPQAFPGTTGTLVCTLKISQPTRRLAPWHPDLHPQTLASTTECTLVLLI